MLGHQAHLRISAVALSFLVSALSEDNVIALDASNFEAYIEKAPLVLVEFYACVIHTLRRSFLVV